MSYKFAIIGLGHFGRTVAYELAKTDAEVLVIDNDEDKIHAIRNDVALAVTLNCTDKKALQAQNIEAMDAVVVGIGEDFESLLLCVAHLMDLKVPRIIAKASNDTQKAILYKMGVREIISPEEEVGISIAHKLLSPSFINFIPLPDHYEIVEIKTPSNIANRTVGEIGTRRNDEQCVCHGFSNPFGIAGVLAH